MRNSKKNYSGINIQYPISQKILSGEKRVETRTYPLPKKLVGVDLLIIETPGRAGKFKARIAGIIRFGDSFKYESKKAFYEDMPRHHVDRASPWAWKEKTCKWGWPIQTVQRFETPITMKKRTGILYTHNITL